MTWPSEALAVLKAAGNGENGEAEKEKERSGRPGQDAPAEEPGISGRSLADVATSIWRLRNRVAAAPEETPRSVSRHLEMAWDALTQAGVEIRDHVGEPFDLGLSLTVVAYQPTPGLTREQVVEAIRPSVFLGDRTFQTGEVIVGTPDPADDASPSAQPRDQTRGT